MTRVVWAVIVALLLAIAVAAPVKMIRAQEVRDLQPQMASEPGQHA